LPRPGGQALCAQLLIEVIDDWGGLDQDMIIAGVSFEQDANGGTTTTLSLKDPRALGGNTAKGWSAPAVPTPTFREDL